MGAGRGGMAVGLGELAAPGMVGLVASYGQVYRPAIMVLPSLVRGERGAGRRASAGFPRIIHLPEHESHSERDTAILILTAHAPSSLG